MTFRLKFEVSFWRSTDGGATLETTGFIAEVEETSFERAAHILATKGHHHRELQIYYPPSMLGPITLAEEGDPK